MRRFLFGFFVASLLGVAPSSPPLGGERTSVSRLGRLEGQGQEVDALEVRAQVRVEGDPAATAMDPSPARPRHRLGLGASPAADRRASTSMIASSRQTNKSGAVYLYDRKELKVKSMIKERESFRSETLSTVYDQ